MADLRTLTPALVPWATYLYDIGKYYDGKLVVTSAFRSPSKQYELWRKWKMGESPIPAAYPGRSQHNYGLAFDMARLGEDPMQDPFLRQLGALWQSWGGTYGGERDPVHFSVH